jgi:hypothetical protein
MRLTDMQRHSACALVSEVACIRIAGGSGTSREASLGDTVEGTRPGGCLTHCSLGASAPWPHMARMAPKCAVQVLYAVSPGFENLQNTKYVLCSHIVMNKCFILFFQTGIIDQLLYSPITDNNHAQKLLPRYPAMYKSAITLSTQDPWNQDIWSSFLRLEINPCHGWLLPSIHVQYFDPLRLRWQNPTSGNHDTSLLNPFLLLHPLDIDVQSLSHVVLVPLYGNEMISTSWAHDKLWMELWIDQALYAERNQLRGIITFVITIGCFTMTVMIAQPKVLHFREHIEFITSPWNWAYWAMKL